MTIHHGRGRWESYAPNVFFKEPFSTSSQTSAASIRLVIKQRCGKYQNHSFQNQRSGKDC